MHWRNTEQTYGWVAVLFHWVVTLVVIGLFALGLWMVDLTYYDPWYRRGPYIHKSIGILLFLIVFLRLAWRLLNPRPLPLPHHSPLEQRFAGIAHVALYGLLIAVMIAGYLISTADGKSIEVFGLFSVPASITSIDQQEDIAGDIHWWLAITLISLAAVHALAALKHHFLDRDHTLLRMLGRMRSDY